MESMILCQAFVILVISFSQQPITINYRIWRLVILKHKTPVIMPVYNSEKHLVQSIDSILKQTYKDFEFIIIDDGSTDNSLSIINSYRLLKDTNINLSSTQSISV